MTAFDFLSIATFERQSVLFLSNLYDASVCSCALDHFLIREQEIIQTYHDDPRGLSCELINGIQTVKYFEYPLHFAPKVYGRFVNSEVLKLATKLLGRDVYLVSCEIHSRSGGGTEIPSHQDNAYYGLSNGHALTVYVALNSQSPANGGLQYIENPISEELEHKPSASKAFSLQIADMGAIASRPRLSFSYSAGDCTIHHSRSIHFASIAPPETQRAIVLRMTFYAESERIRDGHDLWYASMIATNRAL